MNILGSAIIPPTSGGGGSGGGTPPFTTTTTLSSNSGDSNVIPLTSLTPSTPAPEVGNIIQNADGSIKTIVQSVDATNATAITQAQPTSNVPNPPTTGQYLLASIDGVIQRVEAGDLMTEDIE